MAAQEVTLKFKGDPSQLKGALDQLRSQHASTMADVTRQVRAEADTAAALQRQRSSALITIWKADTRAAVQEAQARVRAEAQAARAIEQEEKQLAATMIRESRAAQGIRLQTERAVQQAERATQADRKRQTQQAFADIQRFERERSQIALQNSRIVIVQAKTEADTRIREGRRAANAVIGQLQEELRAARAAQSQVSQTGRGGAFLAGAAGGLTALVGVSAVSEIRQAASAWVDYASKLETTKIAFTTMLGSAQAAQDHLNELQRFALKTPFQFSELIDASQRMQALGFNAEQIVPVLTDVGNAVAAAGGGSERLDRVVLALSQMQSKGRVATQELNQLAEAGISGFKILEAQTGKSRAELVKMVEQGQISSAVFLEAFQKFSQVNFGGLMEQQSKTFLGAMSNIKDALLQTSATAFQPLYDRLADLAKQMADTSTKSNEFKEDMVIAGRELARVWDGAIEVVHAVHSLYRLVIADLVAAFGFWTHAIFATVRASNAARETLLALAAVARGDLAAGLLHAERGQQQFRLSLLELRDAGISASGVFRELGKVMDEANQRASAAAQKIAAAAVILTTKKAGDVIGGSATLGGSFKKETPPLGTGTGSGSGRSSRDAELEKALRAEQAREDVNNRLIDQYNKLQDELRGVNTETHAYAVEQNILNGLLADATPHLQSLARENARLVDNSTTQLRLQKELNAFLVQQAEAVRVVMEGERDHLETAQELIRNLEKQGAVLQDATKFWLQFRATILDANTASERLLETLEKLREAVINSLPAPDIAEDKGAIGREIAAEIGEPPEPPPVPPDVIDSWTILHETAMGALSNIAQGIGGLIHQWVLYGTIGPNAIRKMLAAVLAAAAAQAAVEAIMQLAHAAKEYALGVAAASNPFTAWQAPGHFAAASAHLTAAAVYGTVAGVAAIAGRGIAGDAFQSASGGGSGGGGTSGSGGSQGGTQTSSQTPQVADVNRRPGAPQPALIVQTIEMRIKGDAVIDEWVRDFDLNGRTRLVVKNA